MENTVYRNRELSWLKFNERVLEEAEREDVPLCERLSFVSIFQSNLDEFFMVRVGSLIDQMSVDETYRENKTHMTAAQQLEAIFTQARELNRRKDEVYQQLMDRLEGEGVRLVNFRKITQEESAHLERYFDSHIAPLLSPVIVDKRQPFPFMRNKEIFAAVSLERKNGKRKLGLISCGAGVFPRLIQVSQGEAKTYMLSEELILHFIPKAFKGYTVREKSLIRATRNADIDADALYDDDLDYREFMADLIKRRRRLAPIRLEMSRALGGDMVEELCKYMDVSRDAVFRYTAPLDLSFLFQIQDVLRQRTELFYPKRFPQRSPQFVSGEPILPQIRQKDKLLAYPFDSMKPFLSMLREAAADDKVVSIKMTLYRVAKQSEVVAALIEAAENGKEVTVLMELRARFDEANNINWSESLEEAGCTVLYGLEDYKVHSKVCQITLMEKKKIKRITQVGTGNYNEKTAKLYTDLSLMTADEEIGNDAAVYFKNMSIANINGHYDRLFVAPNSMKDKILALIQGEIEKAQRGEPAEILVKINSLTDRKTIDALKDASQAGVRVRMIIRGICCLLPDVEGYTENIQITSIVGRFLEHSRVYCFGAGEERSMYISSADFMTRNLNRRVEVACPINSPQIKKEILEILELMLSDNVKARNLRYDGLYEKKGIGEGGERIDSQQELLNRAITRAAAPSQSRKTAQEMPVEDDGFFSRLKRAIFG